MTVHRGVFDKVRRVVLQQVLHVRGGTKVVVKTIDFPRSWETGRVGQGQGKDGVWLLLRLLLL